MRASAQQIVLRGEAQCRVVAHRLLYPLRRAQLLGLQPRQPVREHLPLALHPHPRSLCVDHRRGHEGMSALEDAFRHV